MSLFRPASVLVASVLVVAFAATEPARASTEPTTLAVDGTLRVVVVDHFGDDAHADHLYTLETADGAKIPVALPDSAPANGRFSGELVVQGDVASDLAAKDLLPKAGSTIDEDTRAGRVAVASAEQQETPLQVAESSVAPVTAAAVTAPTSHRAYVAVMEGRGSIEESDSAINALVTSVTGYWQTESNGTISTFPIQGFRRFTTTTAGTTAQSCGMNTDPSPVWAEAARKFPGVSFAASSGNHLIVAMADECAGSGVAGIAEVGSSLASGGRMSLSMGTIAKQVGTHEMGHTFGLGHANLQRCASCGVSEYEDLYSPMGLAIQTTPTLDPPALESGFRSALGVAGEVPVLTSADGVATRTVHLDPRAGASGTRGLDVVDPVSGAHYFVEHRSGTARDASTFYSYSPTLSTGVRYSPGLTITTPGDDSSLALLTPAPNEAAFGAGQVFTSPTGSVQVAVGAVGAAGADVTVTFGTVAAPSPAPAAVLARLVTRTPKISGTAKVGRTLKVKVGSWSPRPSYRYQWYAGGKRITSKGTKTSFKLTSKQKGKRITVRVTARKAGYVSVAKTSRAAKRVLKR